MIYFTYMYIIILLITYQGVRLKYLDILTASLLIRMFQEFTHVPMILIRCPNVGLPHTQGTLKH